MKKYVIILLCITIMLTACQPTPENQIVIQKDNFEKLTDTTSVPTNIQEENTKADSANDGKTHVVWNDNKSKTSETPLGEITLETLISVDAMVDLTTKKASIYTVEPVSFELPFIKNTVSYFFGDDYYSPERTKDDYLSQILPLENALPKINSKSRQPAEVSVERWKEKYQTAPENNKRIELKINSGYFDYSCVKGYPYNGAISELYVQNGGMSDTLMYYYVDDINKGYGETKHQYNGTPAIGMCMSYDDARNMALNAAYKIYGNDIAIVETTIANKNNLDETWQPIDSPKIGYKGFGEKDQAYIFYMTRTYNGIPQLYSPAASNNNDLESEYGGYVYDRAWDYEYSMKWRAEYIMVTVDDTGIVEFWGFSPSKIVDLINNDVAMLEFEDIFEIFKKNIYYSSVWTRYYTEELKINITDIKFGMIRAPKKDNPNIYYMIPAWQFIGDKSTYSSRLPKKDRLEEESGKTFMVLNALDGSIVDVSYFENKRLEALKNIGEQVYVNHMDAIAPPPN